MISEQMEEQKKRTMNYESCPECDKMKHISEFSNMGMCQTCKQKLQPVRDRGYY